MDFLFGFFVGYLCKEMVSYLKKLSTYDWNNRNYYHKSYTWQDDIYMTEDDLP